MANDTANITTFEADVLGKKYVFNCREAITDQGLAHVCEDNSGRVSCVVWCNRPWEGFKFEAVLTWAIGKCPEEAREELGRVVLTGARESEEKRMEALLQEFRATYDTLSDGNKEIMKNYPWLQSEDDARRCLAFMKMLALFQ